MNCGIMVLSAGYVNLNLYPGLRNIFDFGMG
jgi:hypothetical protein